MAPSSGQILVPKALKAFKYMVSKGAAYLKARLSQEAGVARQLEAIPVRIAKQPLHPVAALRQRQFQQRNFSTAIRRIVSSVSKPIHAARPIAGQSIRSALSKSTHAPFSSPLRPNLTGGAIPRSSGGYSLGGGGVRHFSSTPVAQAHVVQNVSAAIRAFCINGSKAQYDGMDSRTGMKKFRAVSAIQDKALKTMRQTKPYEKGTTLGFRIAPTITALPFTEAEATLESEDVIMNLASDFSRSLGSLAMIHADIKKLAGLGSLPITCPNPHTLNVRFAGCDAAIVHALCNELGISRGSVREDPEWDELDGDKEVEMALLFPWAPSKPPSEQLFSPVGKAQPAEVLHWQDMISEGSEESFHEHSHDGYSVVYTPLEDELINPWDSLNNSASFDALRESDIESNEQLDFEMDLTRTSTIRQLDTSAYEGMEGVLRFMEHCDTSRR